MHVYFYTIHPGISHKANIAVISSLQSLGATIHSNLEGLSVGEEIPKNIDALVVLGGSQMHESSVSYVVALGIAYRKPILYLLPKRTFLPEEIHKISQTKEIKKFFKIATFSQKRASAVIKTFIDQLVLGSESFNIKFTLRLTSDQNRYLRWRSKRSKMAKADFVRKLIEDYRQSDKNYDK